MFILSRNYCNAFPCYRICCIDFKRAPSRIGMNTDDGVTSSVRFFKRKVNLRGSDSAQSCIAVLKDLKSSNSCPMYRALMTGTGGDGERDIVLAVDWLQCD